MNCKFCGAKIMTEQYTNPSHKKRSCGKCTQYCMKNCELNKTMILSWHSEPCKNCEKNPYNQKGGLK